MKATLQCWDVEFEICSLTVEMHYSVVIPHLRKMDEPPSRRKTGLLWSPADDRLNVGIVCRDFSVDDWIRVKASLLAVLGPTFLRELSPFA